MKQKRKLYMAYPKILTVTCVTCGQVTEVLLQTVHEYRQRFYCSDACEKSYLAEARRHAAESRALVKAGGKSIPYQEKLSQIISERPAPGQSRKKRMTAEQLEAEARKEARRQRDAEYRAALRRSMGLAAEAAQL